MTPISLSFHGAVREVTGSCHLVTAGGRQFLIDCGMFQGKEFSPRQNAAPFGFDPRQLDFVILTHAHLDHCGRLPKLFRDGFRGRIFCTQPTADLAELMLRDSAKVILEEARRRNQPPLYVPADVVKVVSRFTPLPYGDRRVIGPGIEVRLRDAGHILGSAIVELWLTVGGTTTKLVYTGDLGNPPAPIVRDTELIDGADYVVTESTYGNRIHESKAERLTLLRQAIIGSVGQGGVLMIPAFALERTQEVLYELNYLVENKKVPPVPIFVDSPLAIKANQVYRRYLDLYDAESQALLQAGDDLFNFPGLRYTATSQESKAINTARAPKVIIAGSGMCTGGRIPFHLKLYLGQPTAHLLIISYQPVGSLGRRLLEGARSVMINGSRVTVRAHVSAIGGYSSHADQPRIVNWFKAMAKPRPQTVFIVHGELDANTGLADVLKQKLKLTSIIPQRGQTYPVKS